MSNSNVELEQLIAEYIENMLSLDDLREAAKPLLAGNSFYYDSGLYGPIGTIYKLIKNRDARETFRKKVQLDRLTVYKQRVEYSRKRLNTLADEMESLMGDLVEQENVLLESLIEVDGLEILLGIRTLEVDWAEEDEALRDYKWDWGTL